MKGLHLLLAAATGLLLAVASPAAAQSRDSLEIAVQRLSAEVDRLSSKVATLRHRSDTLGRHTAHLPRVTAYLQLGYEWSDDASNFFIKRARLDMNGDAARWLDYRIHMEFASPKVLDIYLRFKPLRELNLQIGQYKVPFTIENTRYVPLRFEFIEYSMAVQRLMGFRDVCGVNATGRDMGVQLYGELFRLNGRRTVEYNLGLFNGEGINTRDRNKSKDLVARLMVYPIEALTLAASGYWGEVGEHCTRRTRYAAGICYDDGRWITRGEYITGTTGRIEELQSPEGTMLQRSTFDSDGYYVMAACWVTPEWLPALRFEQFDEVSGVSTTRQTNYTAAILYKPIKYLRCQLNYTREHYGAPAIPDRNVVALMLTGIF